MINITSLIKINSLRLCDFCFQDKQTSSVDKSHESWSCCVKNCYYISRKEASWDDSKKLCQQHGSSLVKIDDKEEQVCLFVNMELVMMGNLFVMSEKRH